MNDGKSQVAKSTAIQSKLAPPAQAHAKNYVSPFRARLSKNARITLELIHYIMKSYN